MALTRIYGDAKARNRVEEGQKKNSILQLNEKWWAHRQSGKHMNAEHKAKLDESVAECWTLNVAHRPFVGQNARFSAQFFVFDIVKIYLCIYICYISSPMFHRTFQRFLSGACSGGRTTSTKTHTFFCVCVCVYLFWWRNRKQPFNCNELLWMNKRCQYQSDQLRLAFTRLHVNK